MILYTDKKFKDNLERYIWVVEDAKIDPETNLPYDPSEYDILTIWDMCERTGVPVYNSVLQKPMYIYAKLENKNDSEVAYKVEKRKRYWIFAGDNSYDKQCLESYKISYNTLEEVAAWVNGFHMDGCLNWHQVFDSETYEDLSIEYYK